MVSQLAYPFGAPLMRENPAFLLFCPPDCLDEEGRPVLEGRSIFHKLDMRAYRNCPYKDSRSGGEKLINFQGLQQLQKHEADVLTLIDSVAAIGKTPGSLLSPLTGLEKLYALSLALFRAPVYYFIKKVLGQDIAIPATISVASRFCHGLVNTLSMLALENGGRLDTAKLSAVELYLYADRRGYLIGRKGVCAAPKGLLVKYIDFLINACETDPQDNAPIRSERPSVNEINGMCRMVQVMLEFELATLIYETVRCRYWINENSKKCEQVPAQGGKPLFAVSHCLIAQKISRNEKPFEQTLFARSYHLSLITGSREKLFHDLLNSAVNALSSQETCSAGNPQKKADLQHGVKRILEERTEFFREHFSCDSLISADLDLFFGPWPHKQDDLKR